MEKGTALPDRDGLVGLGHDPAPGDSPLTVFASCRDGSEREGREARGGTLPPAGSARARQFAGKGALARWRGSREWRVASARDGRPDPGAFG